MADGHGSLFAPRTVLPSIAITNRPLTCIDRVHSHAPRIWSSVSGASAANARRNVDSSAGPACRAQTRKHVAARISGPLADRGERSRARDHRGDPDREQPGQRMTTTALVAWVGDLGEQIEQVLALRLARASRHRRRWRRRVGVPSWQSTVSVRTSIEPLEPYPPLTDTPSVPPVTPNPQVTRSVQPLCRIPASPTATRNTSPVMSPAAKPG